MKKHSKILLVVLCSVFTIAGFAQQIDTRQKLYASLPQSINIDKNIFASALVASVGDEVSLQLSSDFIFNGNVQSNFTRYNNMHTVMLRSTENAASIFQITVVQTENNISYSGRIINNNAADGFEIKNNNGIYSLQKFETLKILDPCKL